ncbi:MAG TPA: thioredoxin family protein [Flavobacteriales bacterium]|nr:thioredoxin family protein [Flavobacteriales bacterium]
MIRARAEKLRVGDPAPPNLMPTGRSDMIYSREKMGQYELIDFRAGWYGPCTLDNVQFVPIYQEFAPLGFTILRISLDRDTMAWHKAAMQDGVTWFDLCDGKGFGTRPAKDYGVKAVPFNVLVDPDGRILARDLKGPALRRWLSR